MKGRKKLCDVVGKAFLLIVRTWGSNPGSATKWLCDFEPVSLQLWVSISSSLKWERGFPGSTDGKESACHGGDPGSIPWLGRSPGEENGNPLQYSCLENRHGQRSLAGYSPWGRKESDTTEWLTQTHTHTMKIKIQPFSGLWRLNKITELTSCLPCLCLPSWNSLDCCSCHLDLICSLSPGESRTESCCLDGGEVCSSSLTHRPGGHCVASRIDTKKRRAC